MQKHCSFPQHYFSYSQSSDLLATFFMIPGVVDTRAHLEVGIMSVSQSGCLAKLSHVNCDWSTQKTQVVQSLVQDGATSVICVWHCTMQQRRQQG